MAKLEVSRLARFKLFRGRRAGYRGWTRLSVDRLPYLLEAARRAGIPRIVLAREAEAGAGPVIPRIPAAVGRIGAKSSTDESWIVTRSATIGMSPRLE